MVDGLTGKVYPLVTIRQSKVSGQKAGYAIAPDQNRCIWDQVVEKAPQKMNFVLLVS